jgi:hypothetical protein
MTPPPSVPSSLSDYVLVWCADLLAGLAPSRRRDLLQNVAMMYEGGPWPSRLDIQRLAEQMSGEYGGADVFIGDLVAQTPGYVAGMVIGLSDDDPDVREDARRRLAHQPGTPELVAMIEQATAEGHLTSEQRSTILASATSNPVLPEPKEAPPQYPALPPDYPESYAEKIKRDPPYEVFTSRPDQARDLARLESEWQAGLLERQAYRRAMTEVTHRPLGAASSE